MDTIEDAVQWVRGNDPNLRKSVFESFHLIIKIVDYV